MAASILITRTTLSFNRRIVLLPLLRASISILSSRRVRAPTPYLPFRRQLSITRTVNMTSKSHFLETSGENDPVWIHTEPYSKRPQYQKLTEDTKTDVCVIGSGMVGVSVAYELVQRGVKVIMLEARDILSGESGIPER